MNKILFVFLMITFFLFVSGDDGMWLPHQMKGLDLEKEGLKMDPDDLYKKDGTGIMSAVVYLGGGTGSFVSREGLILTNHHVAFGAIQRASDSENDYITSGFLAGTRDKEIPAIGYIADVLLGYEEVTGIFEKALRGITDPEKRYKAIEKLEKQLIAEEEKKAVDRRCVVKSMYSGNQFFLFRFKRIRDVRLVYAPPNSIGNFGGDVDNWMWPRHTGDFTFLRAYVSPDNTGVEFDPGNVPYRPEVHLEVSTDGLKEGDFSFVMGYPGRTYRNMTFSELKAVIDILKERIEYRKQMIGFIEKAWEGNKEVQIRYASLHKGLNNGLKNYSGKLEGFESYGILDLKKRREEEFIEKSKGMKDERILKESLDRVRAHLKNNKALEERSELLYSLTSRYGSAMLGNAYMICRTVLERAKPDQGREPGYQERDYKTIRNRLEHVERSYDFNTDREMFKYMLTLIKNKDRSIWPRALKEVLENNRIGEFVDGLYKKTLINSKETRLKMFEMSRDQIMRTGDPFIVLAAELEKEMKIVRNRQKIADQELMDLKKAYLKVIMSLTGGRLASDANSTIRFTYGSVKGYSPADALYYEPFTTLKGVMEKENGEDPFIVPDKLKDLFSAKAFGPYMDPGRRDMVVCFLNTTNVTGGNSGSPVFNADGKQTGIVFDMTYESVTGDYYVIPEYQRTIHVDIRYVLFVTEYVSGADFLIKEMSVSGRK